MLNDEESLRLISYFLSEFIDPDKSLQDRSVKAAYIARNKIRRLKRENQDLKNDLQFQSSFTDGTDTLINELTIGALKAEIDSLRDQLCNIIMVHNKEMRNLGASLN